MRGKTRVRASSFRPLIRGRGRRGAASLPGTQVCPLTRRSKSCNIPAIEASLLLTCSSEQCFP
jgi:hypothetical protein